MPGAGMDCQGAMVVCSYLYMLLIASVLLHFAHRFYRHADNVSCPYCNLFLLKKKTKKEEHFPEVLSLIINLIHPIRMIPDDC